MVSGAVTPRRWRGEIALDRDGEYDLTAHAAGNPPGEGTFRYRIRPLPDAPPILRVRDLAKACCEAWLANSPRWMAASARATRCAP